MTRLTVWAVALAAAISVLVTTRIDARREGVLVEKNRVLDSAIAADRQQLAATAERLARDSVARVAAGVAAATARRAAAAQKARSDSLDAAVRIVDSGHVVAAGDTLALPPLIIRDLTELRSTVASQVEALHADTIAIHRLEAELATSREETAAARQLSSHVEEKVTALEDARPGWLHRLGGALVTAGTAAGCGAIGAVLGGPAGAAIGAAACVVVSRIAGP